MSEMQESVTRSMTREYIEQGEPSTGGEWHAVSLSDLIKAGWESIAFHYPDDQETPNAVELHGEAPDTATFAFEDDSADEGDEARDCVRVWTEVDKETGQRYQWCAYHRKREPIEPDEATTNAAPNPPAVSRG